MFAVELLICYIRQTAEEFIWLAFAFAVPHWMKGAGCGSPLLRLIFVGPKGMTSRGLTANFVLKPPVNRRFSDDHTMNHRRGHFDSRILILTASMVFFFSG